MNNDTLKKQIISYLNSNVAALAGKIFVSYAREETKCPYAIISEQGIEPMMTVNGYFGDALMSVTIFDTKIANVEQMKYDIKTAMQGHDFDELRCYYKSQESEFYPDEKIYAENIIFKFL